MYDIAVIGGGMNGMTIAAALAEQGFSIAIIEQSCISEKLKNHIDGRGISTARYSKNLLEKYNIWSYISKSQDKIENVGEIHKILIKDGNSSSQLLFDNHLVNNDPLGFLIESDQILKGLYKKLLAHKNIKIIDNEACSNVVQHMNKVSIYLSKNKSIDAKIAIATDGKDSQIRKLLNLPHTNKNYQQAAIVFNVSHEYPHNNIAYEHFFTKGPFALLPLNDPHHSSVVWTEDINSLKLDLSTQEIEDFLNERCSNTHGDIKVITKIRNFPLSLSYMTKYSEGRVVFMGDCLHHIHPLAGQGYNLSLRDIDCFVELITNYRDLGLDIGSKTMMSTFEHSRKLDNFSMIKITDTLNYIFSNNFGIVSVLRRAGLDLVDNIPSLKKFFMEYAMGKNK